MKYFTAEQIKKVSQSYKQMHEKSNYFIREDLISKQIDQGAKVLDIGCGAGELIGQMKKRGIEKIEYVDIADYLTFQPNKLRIADLNKEPLPYEAEEFDCVTAIAILEHLENPWHLAREIRRVLKKQGLAFIARPHVNIQDRIRFLFCENLSSFNLGNNHITYQTPHIFAKCWRGLKLKKVMYSKGIIKVGKRKIRLPDVPLLNKLFGTKVMFVLKKV
jgi:2-polyprenyl-3-methyl-5-hydroxy-6-metoxy-1,4-benzoquinol methylase